MPSNQRLAFDLPAPDAASVGGVVNNNKTHHPFTFNGIFEMDATQVNGCEVSVRIRIKWTEAPTDAS